MVGKSTKDNLEPGGYPDCAKVGNVTVPPCAFVDDVKLMAPNDHSLRNAGHKVTTSLDYLGLSANPSKTTVIVFGKGKKANNMRQRLEASPVIIQGNEIKVVSADTYLGVKISQAGVKDSIKMTFEERKSKAWNKVFAFKKMLRHPAMQRNGHIKSAVGMFRAVIIPTLLYSAECWFGITKGMLNNIEKVYKKMIYSLLDIPTKTKYFAVMSELGLKQARHIIAAQKLNFVNNIAKRDNDNVTVRVLNEDHRLHGDKSILTEVRELCESYNLPDIWNSPCDDDTIKTRVEEENYMQYWKGCLLSNIVICRQRLKTDFKPYHLWPRSDGRSVLLWRCGALRFRSRWRKFNKKNKMDTSCPHPLCPADDNLDHALKCLFMDSKIRGKTDYDIQDDRMCSFLVALNRERSRRYDAPIL